MHTYAQNYSKVPNGKIFLRVGLLFHNTLTKPPKFRQNAVHFVMSQSDVKY